MRTTAQHEQLRSLAAEVMRLGIRQDLAPADLRELARVLQVLLAQVPEAHVEEISDAA
ncbi:hypothetical protein [Methylobacterium sp. WCS2018Hpa-22]|uniref:hypothetical protein n=1 Tax=Methylobacterium sp. WCS2018Hpa-22 TaxID=3073633 RepID=UPI00288B3AFC|nr:hypothetical protein [Methylobacterium sp. WCS2018Hpa-22]